MLAGLINGALKQRIVVVLGAGALAVWGANAYRHLSIDAFPDVAPIQVLVSMRAPGLTPEELESRVTQPIELAVRGIPNLVKMRSTTRYSVVLLTLDFADGTDIYWARAQVNERLSDVRDRLPAGADGGLAPIVTPLAEMVMFRIESESLTPQEKRFLVDWTIRPALRGLPGVADVNVLGGFVRTFEVVPSAAAMAARGITTELLENAIRSNNRNDGAGRIRNGEEALLVRSEGRIQTLDDIRNIIITTRDSSVVRVGDVADVRIGSLARNGVVTVNGEQETVWGMVLGLRGANARTVVDGVKLKFEELKPLLPDGARIEIFYDRSELIGQAVWTVQKVLLEAIALVVILLLVFLGNLRSALVISIILPLAVLITFGIMRLFGWSANIMSLGGLAIAIGLLVDCAVVVVENVEHRLGHAQDPDLKMRLKLTFEATREVALPLVSGVAIIVMVFAPLLSLQGLEGRLFRPVALTIAFALGAALLLSLTVVPTLATYLLRSGSVTEPWLVRKLHAVYDPALAHLMRRPLVLVVGLALGIASVAAVFPRIGAIFMPVMDEGTPVVTIRKFPTVSVEEAAQTDLRIQQALMAEIPVIKGLMARAGADELGIDPVGLNETDMFMSLAPKSEWPNADKQWFLGEVRRVLDSFPGIAYAFTQPIDMRVQEMIIGARGDVVVKVLGDEISTLNRLSRNIAGVLQQIPGAVDVFALRNAGMRYLTVAVDRLKAGRFGLNAEQVQEALRVWVDGRDLGIVLEGQVRTPLLVRGEERQRASASDLARVPIVLPRGGTVELSQIADVRVEDGPIQVIREDGQRFATVLSNVRGRDLVGFVDEAKAAVAGKLKIPRGYTLVWGGQFENQQRASARLALVVPLALAMIFLVLYLTFNSIRQAVLVFCNVPFATIGGVIALWASGEFLSVPASVGFIALMGIAVLNGVVLLSYINEVVTRRELPLRDAVMEGARRRLRPVMLTASVAALGLVPFLFATGPGAEIQRPLAIVVIGGLVTATALTLLLLPVLYERFGLPRSERALLAKVPRQDGAAELAVPEQTLSPEVAHLTSALQPVSKGLRDQPSMLQVMTGITSLPVA